MASVLTDGLTDAQERAVDFYQGPLLVLAGPGSGKTRVITRRIVRLIERGVPPWQILAITFTNRAAREMQQRVDHLLPGMRVWISTFHRFAAATLRKRASLVGLESNFAIFDKSDQLAVIRHALIELDHDTIRVSPAKIAARISKIKNSNTSADDFIKALDVTVGEPFDQIVGQVFRKYQQLLMASNAVDFDDLLLHVVRLFTENPELRAEYDQRFRFLMVDEYQDTNPAQYQIVRALSIDEPNVCAMGDPDQSVYGWRGADIQNILRFERDYPNCEIVRLEQNFRSTARILAAADKLIACNVMRKAKSLLTDNEAGSPVRLHRFMNARDEADGIARAISEHRSAAGTSYSDFAIVYRVNSLSRELELAFTRHRVPYQVAAGVAFYDRAEIKDVLSYLRLVDNPVNQVAFQRIVNKPPRGIGKSTQDLLQKWADENGQSLMDAARQADQVEGLKKTAIVKLRAFVRLMDGFSLANSGSVSDLLKSIVDKTGYARFCGVGTPEHRIERESNIEELINAAAQYDEQNADDPSVTDFLQTTSLVNDDDSLDPNAGSVTLMTMHAAKGTEFPIVFIIGLEHGLIPHERSVKSNDPKELEEERRLLFVAMTRAMKELHLTKADVRAERGAPRMTIPSTFLNETIFETVDESGSIKPTHASSQRDQDLRERLKQAMLAGDKPAIMSGAALLNGTQEEATIPNTFAIGMRVRHPQHGQGTVINVSGFGRKRTVKVEFVNRTETIIVAHSPLQPVGIR